MELFCKLSLAAILLVLSHQQSKACVISNDTVIYKLVIDNLIQITLANKQLHTIIIISESKRLRKPKSPNDESLTYIVHSYAEDSVNYLHNAENHKVLENRQLRSILLSAGQFDRIYIPLRNSGNTAKICYKVNGWSVFKSYKKITQYRKKNPDFFVLLT